MPTTPHKALLRARFLPKMTDVTNEFVPHRKYTNRDSRRARPTWMNDRVRARIKKKKSAFDKFKQSSDDKDYLEYTKARNAAKAETRRAVRDYEREIAGQAKKNPKAFYRHINGKLKTTSGVADIKTEDGREITSDLEKADYFNKYFSTVCTIENEQHMPHLDDRGGPELNSIEVSELQVLDLLRKLKPDKSPGPDNIHPRVCKECAVELAKPLTLLFQRSLADGVLTEAWRGANTTPIFKKGSRSNVANYRPISLTSVCCKTL